MEKSTKDKKDRLFEINAECKEMLDSVDGRNPYKAFEKYGDRLKEIFDANGDLAMDMSFDGHIMPLLWLWRTNRYGPLLELDYGEESRALNSCIRFFRIKPPN